MANILKVKNGSSWEEIPAIKGTDGEDGIDGYSPSASVSKSGSVSTLTVTDKTGTTSVQINDGTDGYSPSASVSKSGSVSTLTVTDKTGTTSVQINDGIGRELPSGGTTGQVLKKASNTDYAVEWDDESGGGGGGVMWVTFTSSGNTHQADKTFSEIMTAVNDGLVVIGKDISGSIFNLYAYTSSYAMFMRTNNTEQQYTLSGWYTIRSNGTVSYNSRTGDFYPGNQDKTLYLAIDDGSSVIGYYSHSDVSDFYYDLYDASYGYVCKPMAVLNEVTEHVVDDESYYDFVRYYLASFTTTGYPNEPVSTLVFKSPGSNATITVEAPWYDYWANATVTKTT